jgi:hypothetical protein
MYSELWDVDVNHNEEVYVVRDDAGEDVSVGGEALEEVPCEAPRD